MRAIASRLFCLFGFVKGLISANASGPYEAVLSRLEIAPYLTQVGKELLK